MTATLQEQLMKINKAELFNNNKELSGIKHKEIKYDNIHSNINKDVTMNKLNYNKDIIRKPKRREIWYVNLGKRNGSVQQNIRPFLITSNPINNQYSTTVNGFPITSKVLSKSNIPVHVEIEDFGLKEKSLVLAEQITTIDVRYDLISYVGTVDELTMRRIDRARNIQLGDMRLKNTLERLQPEMQEYIIGSFKMIDTYEVTIETMKINSVPLNAIDLIEDQKFREECGLKTYCYKNNINYEEVYNNFVEIMKEKEENIAL